MTTPTPKNSFTANEPVVIGAFVTWLFSLVGSIILGHTDLVSADQWGSLSTILVPVVSALLITAIAWLVRKVVAPAWKLLTGVTHTMGIPDEVLIQLASHGVTQELRDLSVKYPELGKLIAAIEAGQKNQTGS